MHPEKLKNNPSASFVVLVALAFVLSYGSAEARSAHSHEHQPLFSNQNTDSARSCPLIHHPEREVCPLTHHGRIGYVLVVKSCGNGSAEGVSSSFSKETVAVGAICDSRLSLSERALVFSQPFYNVLLPNPLDHPPKSL